MTHPIPTLPTPTAEARNRSRRRPHWRTWNLVALTGLTSYSTALGWLAQEVIYPLYRTVGEHEFPAYHLQYNEAIVWPVIVPGFLGFFSAAAFIWTAPADVGRWAARAVSLSGATCIASTVLWAIPMHDRLDEIGRSAETIDSLLAANLVRTAALTISLGVLGWCVGRLLSQGAADQLLPVEHEPAQSGQGG